MGKAPPENSFFKSLRPFRGKIYTNNAGDRLYVWDYSHGEIEVYNKNGYHLSVLDENGKYIKPAVKGRKIDV